MKEEIISIIRAINDMEDSVQISADLDLIEGDLLDSMGIVQLVMELQNKFNISEIDPEDIIPENFSTVTQIEELVGRYQKAEAK